MRNKKYFAVLIICLLFICCSNNNKVSKKVKYYFLAYNHNIKNDWDTIHIVKPDTVAKDMIPIHGFGSQTKIAPETILKNMIPIDTSDFKYKNIRIIKYARTLDLGADWSFVAYWEKNVGTFYMRSTIDSRIYRLKSSCDSINDYISTLTSFVLSRPNLFCVPNLPPYIKADSLY